MTHLCPTNGLVAIGRALSENLRAHPGSGLVSAVQRMPIDFQQVIGSLGSVDGVSKARTNESLQSSKESA